MSEIKNSYIHQQKSNQTHPAKIDLEPEEHLSAPEDNETCMSTIKNKLSHYTDVMANYFECTRIFSSEKLEEIRRKSAEEELESDDVNKSSKAKSEVSHESEKFSQFENKSEFKNYTKTEKEVYILDYNELPVHNYSSNQKLKFNKRYAENYSNSYSERVGTFCYSFEEVQMERLRQYEKKSKTCWEELKRLLCCRGGNYLEELDEIETDAVSEVPAMITRAKGKEPSLKATPQDNIFLFEDNNTPPELPFTKPNKKKNIKPKINDFENKSNTFGSQQKKPIFEKQGQFGEEIFSHEVNPNGEYVSDEKYQEEAIKNKEKNKNYINYNESVINVNTNRSRESAVMDSYREENEANYGKKEHQNENRSVYEYNEISNSQKNNQVFKKGNQKSNNANSSSNNNKNEYNSSSYENLAAYNDQENIGYEDHSNPYISESKNSRNARNNKDDNIQNDYSNNIKGSDSNSYENNRNNNTTNNYGQEYKNNSISSANTFGNPENNRYSEHDAAENNSLNSAPSLITKAEIPATYSQGKRLKSKKNKGFKLDNEGEESIENSSSHFSQSKPVFFNGTPDNQIEAEYDDGSQEVPSFKAHKKSKKSNLMMKEADSIDLELNDIPEINEERPYVETSAFKKKRKDKKSKTHTVPLFEENQQDQIDIIYEENQQEENNDEMIKGATTGVDGNELSQNVPQQMFKKQKKNKRKNLVVTNKDEQDTYDLEEI